MSESTFKVIHMCSISTKAIYSAQKSNIPKLCSSSRVDFDIFNIASRQQSLSTAM